jgi:mono/diheme cytochrome c family protein
MSILRKIGIVLATLLGLCVLVAAVFYGVASSKMNRTYTVPAESIAVAGDSATIARGHHLATAISKCVDCHGDNLAGQKFIDAMPLGVFIAPNLTAGKGGLGATFSNADYERAIRHGVKPDGHGVAFMPSSEFQYYDDADFAALLAYIRSVPPVDNVLPLSTVGPLGRALVATGKLPLYQAAFVTVRAPHPAAPPVGVTREYGGYLAQIGGCTGCHGPGLSGGHVPGTPPEFKPAANLTPTGIGSWSEADFFTALRTGKRPDGSALDPFMPWKMAGQMSDVEIRAVWAFLKTVPKKEFGNR